MSKFVTIYMGKINLRPYELTIPGANWNFFRENPVRSATCMPKPNNILDFNQALTFNLEITELRRVKRRWSTVSAGAGRFRMERQLSRR